MENKLLNFIQNNSPDGGFLQSEYWKKFQESYGQKVFTVLAENNKAPVAYANILTHKLPIVGGYFYIPRGPVVGKPNIRVFLNDLIGLAEKSNINWVRIEPASEEILASIENNLPKKYKIKKSSVDMQPREALVMDISKGEEEILAEMKQKTRYNIRLAEKKNIKIFASRDAKYIEEFLRLVKITSERDKIRSHPDGYYRKMLESIPPEILKLYVAEYEGKIIAANLVLFFGNTATYMHGASASVHREVMAPYLLQWRQVLDAKKAGCARYDFGGIRTEKKSNSWAGITKFKIGFLPEAKPAQFPGSYDIILNSSRYSLYRFLQFIKKCFI